MEYRMTTPTPDNNKKLYKIVGAVIFLIIICLVIGVIAMGFFSPASHQKIPPQNLTPASPSTPITPPTGAAGTLVPVAIEGTGFAYGPSPSIWLAKTGEPDIPAMDVMVISPTQLICTFPLTASSVSTGQWDVYRRNTGEQSGSKIGVFTVVDEKSPPVTWNWSTQAGWEGWEHSASCRGTSGKTGSCVEYGPVIVDGHGEYGSSVTYDRVPTESQVSKTFTAPAGTRWNTLTFSGQLSSSRVPLARWMTIDVNGVRVFYANASQTPPGNGQEFSITQSFTPANSVTIRIAGGQDPTFGTSLFTTQFNSLSLS